MYEFTVTSEFLLIIVAGGLALAFDYFPGLAQWFDALSTAAKRQLNAGLIVGVSAVIFAGTCWAVFITNLVCTTKGALDLLSIVFVAISVNQGVHLLTKPTQAFKARLFGAKK